MGAGALRARLYAAAEGFFFARAFFAAAGFEALPDAE
jgi:hypothetical protein